VLLTVFPAVSELDDPTFNAWVPTVPPFVREPPPLAVIAPAFAVKSTPLFTVKVPRLMTVAPEYSGVAAITNMPAPDLVKLPALAM